MIVDEWFKFLIRHLNMPNVSILCLDQIMNLQLDYKIECKDIDLD